MTAAFIHGWQTTLRRVPFAALFAAHQQTYLGPLYFVGEGMDPVSLRSTRFCKVFCKDRFPADVLNSMPRVLVIDDDPEMRSVLCDILRTAGYDVLEASGGQQGFELQSKTPADVLITDLYMPNQSGLETALQFRRSYPGIKIIAISGAEHKEDMLSVAQRLRAVRCIGKPFPPDELLNAVSEVLESQ